MSTTVHLPPKLLQSVDQRARNLGMSRNRYIIRALKRAVDSETGWSPQFVEALAEARSDAEGREALEEMAAVIAERRTRKAPPEW